MPSSKKKSSKSQSRLSNSDNSSSIQSSALKSPSTPVVDAEPSEDELRCALEEASRKFPAFVGKSDFIGGVSCDVDTAEKRGRGSRWVWLSEQAMVTNGFSPGSTVSVSLASLRKGLADGFPLSPLADECATQFGIELRDQTADEAGNYFVIAKIFPSSKVLKGTVRLSSSLSYTMGCPTSGRTVFVHLIQSQFLNDAFHGRYETGRSSSTKIDHIYQCKDLYLELAPSKVMPSINFSGECSLGQSGNGIESSPKTPLYRPKITNSATSQLTSPKYEESASDLKCPKSFSVGSFDICEVLGDESAKKFFQIRAVTWLYSHCLLRGNLVMIPVLANLCFFYVKGAEKFLFNNTDKDLVNGGTQDPRLQEFLNYAFVINHETKVSVSVSSNPASETQQASGAPIPFPEFKDIEDSLRTVPTKIGGLSKEYRILKDIISSLSKDTLSSFGLRSTKGVLLHGPPGTGKTSLVQLCAYDAGVNLICVNGPEIISQYYGESEQALHQVFESAGRDSPAVVFIDELDAIAPSRKDGGEELSQRMVATLLNLMDGISRRDGLLIIAATNRPDCIEPALRRPGRFDREIELGIPSPQQRLDILQTLMCELEHSLSDIQVQHLAMTTHGFVGADLAALCNEAALVCLKRYVKLKKCSRELCSNKTSLAFEESSDSTVEASVFSNDMSLEITLPLCPKGAAKSENNGTDDDKCVVKVELEDFERAGMKVRPSAMREVVLEVPKVNWEDVGGQMEVKRQLMEMVEWPQKHQEAFKRIGIRPPTGVLMFGPPGCSKTLMARAVASEAGLNFLAVKGPELFSKWVGESEKAVRSLFAKARANAPAIIFFDEIDGLAIVRGKDSDGVSVADRVMSQLLVELDGLHQRVDVTVIAATNRPDKIDPALLRPGRFDRLLYVGPPNETDRGEIFRIHLRKIPCSSNVNVREMARLTEGVTGADISLICREAALAALQESLDASEITMAHLKTAVSRVEPSDVHSFEELSAKFQRLVSSDATGDKLIQQESSRVSTGFSFLTTVKSALLSFCQFPAILSSSKLL